MDMGKRRKIMPQQGLTFMEEKFHCEDARNGLHRIQPKSSKENNVLQVLFEFGELCSHNFGTKSKGQIYDFKHFVFGFVRSSTSASQKGEVGSIECMTSNSNYNVEGKS
jgi:hypothetical protein